MADEKKKTKTHYNWTGGPHGLGEPDDRSLRKVESDVLIPKIIRDRSRAEKCVPEVKAFSDCCADNGLLMVVKCRKENTELQACLGRWFRNEEFVAECKEKYFEERSEYRRTGIPKKAREAQPMGTNRIGSSM